MSLLLLLVIVATLSLHLVDGYQLTFGNTWGSSENKQLAGASVTGNIWVTLSATNWEEQSIRRVIFKIDGQLVNTDKTAPFKLWGGGKYPVSSLLTNGKHLMDAIVVLKSGIKKKLAVTFNVYGSTVSPQIVEPEPAPAPVQDPAPVPAPAPVQEPTPGAQLGSTPLLPRTTTNLTPADFLAAHNALRCKHGVPPLKWSSSLEETARATSSKFSPGNWEHSDYPVGENLHVRIASSPPDAEGVTDNWYSEIKAYNFNDPQFTAGHFTQVVWKGSTHLGCAVSKFGTDRWYTTCQYSPPGNYQGQYTNNVPKLVSNPSCP